nr:hypothetical protein [Salinarchaeum sp. Harcht-Bsk1]
MRRWTRRRLLASGTAAIGGFAGCLGDDSDAGDGDGSGGENGDGSDGDDRSTTADGGESDESNSDDDVEDSGTDGGSDDLDLREANVTAVAVETEGDGAYRFDVTLLHDDDGEDGYANWWQVETPDGERLGRRELLHAHGTEEFTRSETVTVPAEESCVVVRGHDQTHGYGGQAMLVTIESGATDPRRQGSEPSGFGDAKCP